MNRQKPRDQHAVALTYRQEHGAPQVVAKGSGMLAEAIIARAREAGVYVHESPELVKLLMQVDMDQSIPPQLYLAVAELLAWIYAVEQSASKPALAQSI
ncbi:MAG: EscU/YscU/HrcU family type III secretion system export apparatus switch protein [Burkholderiales bacterium]